MLASKIPPIAHHQSGIPANPVGFLGIVVGVYPELWTCPNQTSTGAPPAPSLSPTRSNVMPILSAISHSVLSAGSLSLYPRRIRGDRDEVADKATKFCKVRTRDGKDAVLYVTSAILETTHDWLVKYLRQVPGPYTMRSKPVWREFTSVGRSSSSQSSTNA